MKYSVKRVLDLATVSGKAVRGLGGREHGKRKRSRIWRNDL